MTPDEAEEYTDSLGQIMAGSWRQILWAQRQGIPEVLGLTTREWVEQRLGGYVKMAVPDRREAVAVLLNEEGLSQREAADVLGVSRPTVTGDARAVNSDQPDPDPDPESDAGPVNSDQPDPDPESDEDREVREAREARSRETSMDSQCNGYFGQVRFNLAAVIRMQEEGYDPFERPNPSGAHNIPEIRQLLDVIDGTVVTDDALRAFMEGNN